MRQTRLSICCRDWQQTVLALGLDAAALYLYLRTIMRTMQAAEVTVTVSEIAEAVKQPAERVETALAAICAAGYFTKKGARAAQSATITLSCPDEKRALAEAARKRSARALARSKKMCGQSGYIFFAQSGQSADSPASHADASEQKEYTSEVMMVYSPEQDGMSEHTLFEQNKREKQKNKKSPPHPQKTKKSLTESTGRADMREAELPVDGLETEYIDVIGSWPASLRNAIRGETDDVREAFYLCVRKRQDDEGRKWSADRVRMALLAAKRIPQERRAESILAWGMGGWKTIRDCGSGVYFEKETGRVVSLVRGTVQRTDARSDFEKQNSELATALARSMRRD